MNSQRAVLTAPVTKPNNDNDVENKLNVLESVSHSQYIIIIETLWASNMIL